ncbi:leucine Rich repeat-containing domain protein [Umbribacter vaginalis]|nr:leucine Rich repeat-containing domain protein [Coriobacteriales bacterium DNF00809]
MWGALATCALSVCAFSAFASYAQGAPEPPGNTPPAQTQQDNPPQQSQQNLIPIDEEHFPDAMFRSLIEKHVDAPQSTGLAGDKKLSADEIANAKRLNIDWVSGGAQSDVYDFKGIEYLTALEELHFIGTPGDSLKTVKLDVNKNTQLKKLDGTWAALKHLDLSHNTKLEELTVNGSGLEGELDLSHNTKLKNVQCFNTHLAAVSLPKTSTLTNVNVSNTKIRQLDVAGLSNLETLNVSQCALVALDVSSCTNLKQLYVQKSTLHMLDVSACKQLKNLDISNAALLGITFGDAIPDMLMGDQTTQKVHVTSASNSIDLKTYAPSINPACIENLKNATLSGTTLTVTNPSSAVTYNYRFGGDTNDCLSVELTLDVQGSAETSAQSLATLFPDKALCAYMKRFDTNNDGVLSADELEKITALEICGAPSGAAPSGATPSGATLSGAAQVFDRTAKLDAAHAIYSFAGIEHLKNLRVFKFAGNASSDQQAARTIHLDLSKNTQLTNLVVQSDEALDALNVASLSKLEQLECYGAGILRLDVSQNGALKQLVVIGSSAKKVPLTLKSSSLTALQGIHVEHCVIDKADKLGLAFAQSPQLKSVSIIDTNAKKIDLLNNKQLLTVEVRDNATCSMLFLSSFKPNWSIERNTKLVQLNINAGKMTFDDIRAAYKACSQPAILNVTSTSADVSYVFDAAFDGLDELDLSGDAQSVEVKLIPSLSTLDVTGLENLKMLDVSTLPALTTLSYETTLKELKLLQAQRDKLADASNTQTKITVVDVSAPDTHSGDQPGTSGQGTEQPGTTPGQSGTTTEQPGTTGHENPSQPGTLSDTHTQTHSGDASSPDSNTSHSSAHDTNEHFQNNTESVEPTVLNIKAGNGAETLNTLQPYQAILEASRALSADAPRVQLSDVSLHTASQMTEKPQIVCATLAPSALSAEHQAQYAKVLDELSSMEQHSNAVLFDVSMLVNNALKHDAFGSLTFSFTVPGAHDGRVVAVWHMHQSGEITKQFVSVKNGKASVTVSDLSLFAYALMSENFVVKQSNNAITAPSSSANTTQSITAPNTQADNTVSGASAQDNAAGTNGMPRTSDTVALLMAFALSVCSVVILCTYRRFSTHR